ncbi:MAG: hypothetical protein ACUVSK_03695 [Desulfotomaculales bacterium]
MPLAVLSPKICFCVVTAVLTEVYCPVANLDVTQLARNYGMDIRRDLEVLGGNLVAEFLRREKESIKLP